MHVKWSYLPAKFHAEATEEILAKLREFVPTGQFTLGKPVQEFEERFAALIGSRHAIGLNSGTDAIKLALWGLGIGRGDEVITAANTFVATVGAINEIGATPVLVDCLDNFCMDVSKVEVKITRRTRAIIPVQLAGYMTNMPALMKMADHECLHVVEDACQCLLGDIGGKRAGTWGAAGCFSLHPLKNLNVWGDGGVLVTDDDVLANQVRRLRNHGLADRDTVVMMGMNSRLDSVQAIVGNWLIDQVPGITEARAAHAARLDAALSQIPQIGFPTKHSGVKLAHHLYIVFAKNRNELHRHLLDNQIEAKVHYPTPLYLQPALRKLLGHKPGDFPMADWLADNMISLPAHEHLTVEQIDYMADTIAGFYARSSVAVAAE